MGKSYNGARHDEGPPTGGRISLDGLPNSHAMLEILGIDSTRSVQAALLVDIVARLGMVGFDFHGRKRLFVEVAHVVGLWGSLGGDKTRWTSRGRSDWLYAQR